MKTHTRSVPLDMLSVHEGNQHIRVFTHRNSIIVLLEEDGSAVISDSTFTFDQFHEALRRICQEAAEAPQEPSPLSCIDSDGKTPSGALQELRNEAL